MSNKVVEEMPEYEELYKRIIKSIKNPQKRLESFMQLSLLAIIFRNNHHQKCKTYKASIDKTMKDIEGIKEQLNSLLTQDEATLSQVVSSKDFQAKCVNVERIYLACNRLYEVLKILEGASNLKFRLNKLRTDLNNIYTSINCKQSVQIPLIGEVLPPFSIVAHANAALNLFPHFHSVHAGRCRTQTLKHTCLQSVPRGRRSAARCGDARIVQDAHSLTIMFIYEVKKGLTRPEEEQEATQNYC